MRGVLKFAPKNTKLMARINYLKNFLLNDNRFKKLYQFLNTYHNIKSQNSNNKHKKRILKQVMNRKNIILALIACMSVVLLILPMFLDVWAVSADGKTLYGYGLFNNFNNIRPLFVQHNGKFYGAWAVLTRMVAVTAMLAGLGFVLFSVLQLLRPRKHFYNFLRRLMSYILMASFLLSVIFGIAFTLSNNYYYNFFNIGNGFISMKAEIGFYMLIAGAFLSGVFGFFSTLRKSPKKDFS